MHTKRLGSYGEMVVASELMKLGYSVFMELADMSKKDLVLEYKGRLLGVQVKTTHKKAGGYQVNLVKSGANYKHRYKLDDFDILAIYCIEENTVAWMTIKELVEYKSTITLRADTPKNNQVERSNPLIDYIDVMRVLRDYEPSTLPSNVGGDDIVQTTTADSRLAKVKVVK